MCDDKEEYFEVEKPWFHDRNAYESAMNDVNFMDGATPKFNIGDRVTIMHTCPGNEGTIVNISDPRMAFAIIGHNVYPNITKTWSGYLQTDRATISKQYVYTLQFDVPTVSIMLPPGTPKEVIDQYKRTFINVCEGDITLTSDFLKDMEEQMGEGDEK